MTDLVYHCTSNVHDQRGLHQPAAKSQMTRRLQNLTTQEHNNTHVTRRTMALCVFCSGANQTRSR
jgi:hypothetical protein